MGRNSTSNIEVNHLESKCKEFELSQLQSSKKPQKGKVKTKKNKEEQGKLWLDNSPVCTKIIDGDFNLKYMSNAGIQALKIEGVDSYYGKPYPFEFFPDFAKNTMKEKMVEVKKTGKTLTVETWVLDMEGAELCFLSTLTRINNQDGSFNYLMVVSTEITARKKVEAQLLALNKDLKQSNEALSKTNKKRKVINSFSVIIQKAVTINDVVWSVAKNVISKLDYVDCVIYLLDETEEYMVQKAAYGNKNPRRREILNPIKLKIGEGIVGKVALNKRGEIISDTSKDERYVLDDVQRLSEITVPIIYKNKVIGVIDSEHPEANFFSKDCLELLGTIASMSATKIIQLKYYEKLKSSTSKLEEAQMIAKLGHYEFDFLTKLWVSSKEVDDILGIDEIHENDYKDYVDFIGYENINEIRKYFNELLDSKSKKFNKEHRVVNRKTKKIKWIINKGVFVYDKSGSPVKIFGTIQDITERKIIEDRLKNRQERFRSLFENSMEITLIVDKTGVIEFITKAVQSVMGFHANELIGQNIFTYIHPDDAEEAYDRFETRYKEGGDGVYRIFKVKTKAGDYKDLRMITSNQLSQPSINGFVINAHDVSALINAENEKYKAVFETKENERKRISHDLHDGLGQTIAAASMYMNFLDESLSNQLDNKTYQLFEEGKKLVHNATKEARVVSHNFMPVFLKDFGIEYALRKLLKNYEIIKNDLTVSLNSNLDGKRFESDMELNLFRIAQELISNAMKHAKCTSIKVNFEIDKTNLLFEVIDNGVGFNIDEIDKIQSSGIGLAGLKERVGFLDGKLLIASSALNGTQITLMFEDIF